MPISSIVSTQIVTAGPEPGQIQIPDPTGPQSAALILFEGDHTVDLELRHDPEDTSGYPVPAGVSKLSGPWQLSANPPEYLHATDSVDVRVTVLKGDRIDHHDIAADQIEAIRSHIQAIANGDVELQADRQPRANTTSDYTTPNEYSPVEGSGVLARSRNVVTCVVDNTGTDSADVRLTSRYNDGTTTGPWSPVSPGTNDVAEVLELAPSAVTRLYVREALLHEYRVEARSSVTDSSTTLDTYETAKG